jgi:hypothetical protein
MKTLILTLCLMCVAARAEIIQSSNRTDWIVGSTVGVQGGIPARTGTVRDVTQAPYNAPFNLDGLTMPASAKSAIEAAIAASSSNDVVYIPAGHYNITNGLDFDKTGVTVRGAGSNTVLYGHIVWGHPVSGNYSFYATNGGAKGTTNLVLTATQDIFGESIGPGDVFGISAEFSTTNEMFPYISVSGYKYQLSQCVALHSVSGNTVSITAPLVFDFTNGNTHLLSRSLTGSGGGFRPKRMMGIENLTVLGSNYSTGWQEIYNLIDATVIRDSWVTNVNAFHPGNYALSIDYSVHIQVENCWIGKGVGAGTSHSGVLLARSSGVLVQNNIISDVPQLGMMFNDGFSGNAIFANFFTNNMANGDIVCHNTHPVMNLFEANHIPVKFMMDGYFGSASHQTLFRNWFHGSISFKRWITYMQTVGNIFGITNGYSYQWLYNETNGFTAYPIFELGFPNIGNTGYIGTSPPLLFNNPGTNFSGFSGENFTNFAFLITNAPAEATNQITTNMGINLAPSGLASYPAPVVGGYPLKFLDATNPKKYWPDTGTPVLTASAGTSSNLMLQSSVWLSNGWVVALAGQTAYQQLQQSNKYTHTLHGNLVYTNNRPGLVWDAAIVDHDLADSILHPAGAPSWWGTNRWPAYDPEGSPYVAVLPAQNRYYGIDNGTATNAPGQPTLVATAGDAQVVLSWSPSGQAADGFSISRGTASGSLSAVTNIGAVTSWTNTGLANGTTYYYSITASNAYGFSSASTEKSATPSGGEPSNPRRLRVKLKRQ